MRVTWNRSGGGNFSSVNAPLSPAETPLLGVDIYNLSDLLFYLSGEEPIKVPQRSRDPNSPMIRLIFRDIWWYCYLDQAHLDSSFFRLEDPFRGRKSQDAMRFFTGLHSERLSQLQAELYQTLAEQQSAREAVAQIRLFWERFGLGSELEVASQIETTTNRLRIAEEQKQKLEKKRESSLHPTDSLREKLRGLGRTVSDLKEAVSVSQSTLAEQEALRAEFITTKVKAERAEQAGRILGGVEYSKCPECGSDISERPLVKDHCQLCGTTTIGENARTSMEREAMRRELNDRIDQIADSIKRRRQALERSKRELQNVEREKMQLDKQLEDELARYDSAFVENIRGIEREIATLEERRRSLVQLQQMTKAIGEQEEKAGSLQGSIDSLRSKIEEERKKFRSADKNTQKIAKQSKSIMLNVGFPGVSDDDKVVLDPRNWKPVIVHSDQEWGFWDTGSGGKKTLFNVCYALAIHEVAKERGMPVPNILIIDSPTKNISDDENPELVKSLYREIYRFAADTNGESTQFLLIDSDLVTPEVKLDDFRSRRMAGKPEAPSLIPYYDGP